jgi:hypothetical protein
MVGWWDDGGGAGGGGGGAAGAAGAAGAEWRMVSEEWWVGGMAEKRDQEDLKRLMVIWQYSKRTGNRVMKGKRKGKESRVSLQCLSSYQQWNCREKMEMPEM